MAAVDVSPTDVRDQMYVTRKDLTPSASENFILFIILSGVAILFFLIAFFSEGTFDSGDGVHHYLIARYSWKHPELLLHHWGKPIFTLFCSPFAQFGLKGATFFNILCALFSSYFCFRICKMFDLRFSFLVVIFLTFSPIYFATAQSGLTEPLFGLVLIVSIYLFLKKTFLLSSVALSFLPFVRSEGNLIIPLFILLLVYRKQYFVIPFLFVGTFIYSIAGYYYFDDLFWVINQNPYKGAYDIYGKGPLTHFIAHYEFIWGIALFALFIAGCIYLLKEKVSSLKKRALTYDFLPEELVLIFGSFLIYFVAHSVVWWKGAFSSLGLIRVMAGVMPVSAIMSLRGLNFILPVFRKNRIAELAFLICLSTYVIWVPFKQFTVPFRLGMEEPTLKIAAEWLKQTEYINKKMFFLAPYLTVFLDLDRFDRETNDELRSLNPEHPELDMPTGSIMIWDAHFGPNEGRIKLEALRNNKEFILLNKFTPEHPFEVLGGYNYEVYIYQRK